MIHKESGASLECHVAMQAELYTNRTTCAPRLYKTSACKLQGVPQHQAMKAPQYWQR